MINRYFEPIALLEVYVVSYLCYRYALHVHFDATPLSYYMQYLDVELLRHDLLRSLWYLHSQPPLMNFIVGIALKLSGGQPDMLLAILYFVAGAVALLYLNAALALLGVRTSARALSALFLCALPGFMLYANWAYTTHLELALCCAVLYYLARLGARDRLTYRDGFALFIPCMLLALLRSQWHLLMFVMLLLCIVAYRRKASGKRDFAYGSGVALSPVVLWYLKNMLLFGFFGASSWMGMNLGEVAADITPVSEIQKLQQQGEVSPYFPVRYVAEKADAARVKWEQSGRWAAHIDHPALARKKQNGQPNHNYLPYIEGSKQDLHDSLVIIADAPGHYIESVARRIADASAESSLESTVGPPDAARFLHGFDGEWMRLGNRIFYIYAPALLLLISFSRNAYVAGHRGTLWAAMLLTLAIVISSSAFTYGGETVRMRWATEVFFLAFLAMLAEMILRKKA